MMITFIAMYACDMCTYMAATLNPDSDPITGKEIVVIAESVTNA